jgi:phage gp36-like protein
MQYVTLNDFYLIIQPEQLNQIVGNSGTQQLDLAVQIAMAEVKSYLIQKYDIDAEYNFTGTTRSLQLVISVIDVALFVLHSRIAPMNIPELRMKRYDQTINWLKGCARGQVTPDLAEIDITQTGARIRFGSDEKQQNKY